MHFSKTIVMTASFYFVLTFYISLPPTAANSVATSGAATPHTDDKTARDDPSCRHHCGRRLVPPRRPVCSCHMTCLVHRTCCHDFRDVCSKMAEFGEVRLHQQMTTNISCLQVRLFPSKNNYFF